MIKSLQTSDQTQTSFSIQFPLLQHSEFMLNSVLWQPLRRDAAGNKVVCLIDKDMNVISYNLCKTLSDLVRSNSVTTANELIELVDSLELSMHCLHTIHTSNNMDTEFMLIIKHNFGTRQDIENLF